MAITARLDEAAGTVTLTHPDRPPLTFDPDTDSAAFLAWVAKRPPGFISKTTGGWRKR